MSRKPLVWLTAIGLFVVGDIATTAYGLQVGAVESNPTVSALYGRPGVVEMLVAKAVVVGFVLSGVRLLVEEYRLYPPVTLALLGLLIVGWNLNILVQL